MGAGPGTSGGSIVLTGAATVVATSSMVANATANGGSVGVGGSVQIMMPTATVSGTTRAYVGQGTTLTALTLNVTATAPTMTATAYSKAQGIGGFGSGQGVTAKAIVSGVVEAFIGAAANVNSYGVAGNVTVSGATTIFSDAFMKAKATADGDGAGGIAVSVMLPTARVSGITRSFVRDGVKLTAGSLDVQAGRTGDLVQYVAEATTLVRQIGFLGAASIANADAFVEGAVEAFLGAPSGRTGADTSAADTTVAGAVNVEAWSDMSSTAVANGGGAAAGVSVSVMVPTAEISGATRAYAGAGTDIRSGSLNIHADGTTNADATTIAIAIGGLGAGNGVFATATVANTVEAFLGERADTGATSLSTVDVKTAAGARGAVTLAAVANSTALAKANGVAVGGIAVNIMIPKASLSGSTRTYIGPWTDLYAGTVTGTASDPVASATATTTSGSLALASVASMISRAVTSRATEAFVGHDANLDLGASALSLTASSPAHTATANITGGSGGIATVTIFQGEATVGDDTVKGAPARARTAAFIGNSAVVVAGNVTLSATGVATALADSKFISISAFGSGSVGGSVAKTAHDAEAYVGDDAQITVAGTLRIVATNTATATPTISWVSARPVSASRFSTRDPSPTVTRVPGSARVPRSPPVQWTSTPRPRTTRRRASYRRLSVSSCRWAFSRPRPRTSERRSRGSAQAAGGREAPATGRQ